MKIKPSKPGVFNLRYSSFKTPENWLSFDDPAEFLDEVIRVAKEPGTEVVAWFTCGSHDIHDFCNGVIELACQMWDDTKAIVCSRN